MPSSLSASYRPNECREQSAKVRRREAPSSDPRRQAIAQRAPIAVAVVLGGSFLAGPAGARPKADATHPSGVRPSVTTAIEADPSATILVVRTAGDTAVMRRVCEELRASGWRIVELDRADGSSESLASLAAEQGAVAALRLDMRFGRIELHVRRSWGNVDEVMRNDTEAVDDQILAIRTTEALRAHGLDLGPAGSTRAATEPQIRSAAAETPRAPSATRAPNPRLPETANHVIAPPQTKDSVNVPARGLWIQLAPGIAGSPGGLPVTVASWIGLRLELSRSWSLVAFGSLAVTTARVEEAQNLARVSTNLVGFGLERHWLRSRRGALATGLGVARVLVQTEGRRVGPGYSPVRDTVGTTAPCVEARAALVLGTGWNAFAAVLGGMSYPEVSIAFGDQVVRTWGQPFALVGLGFEMQSFYW